MERTESMVVQVAPDYENDKIKEMALFGWNLQGRQEIMGHLKEAETPDNFFVAMGRGMKEGATGKKTYEYDHYVKLHFVRSLNLPNLSEIKKLETEYCNLPYPSAPSLTWPVIVTLLPIPGTIGIIAAIFDPKGPGPGPFIGTLIVPIPWIALGYRWIKSRSKKRNEARETRKQSEQRGYEIGEQLSQLIDHSNL